RVLQVLAHVALRIDDRSGLAALVGDQVGSVREAAEVVLLEHHVSYPPAQPLVSESSGILRSGPAQWPSAASRRRRGITSPAIRSSTGSCSGPGWSRTNSF